MLAALSPGQLGPAGRAELDRLVQRERILQEELTLVARTLAATGAEHLLLRGPAMGRGYPPGWRRQYNDLDVLLRHEEQLTAVLEALAEHGYHLARPIVCRAQRGRAWLAAALNRTVPGLGHPAYLDLSTLGPGLGATGAFVLPDAAWASLERLACTGAGPEAGSEARTGKGTQVGTEAGTEAGAGASAGIPVLAAHWQAAVFVVELVERAGCFVDRDLLDLRSLELAGACWPEVARRLSGAPEALAALREAADSFGLALDLRADGVPEAAAARRRAAAAPIRPGLTTRCGSRGHAVAVAWRTRIPAAVARAQRAGRKVNPRATRTLIRRFPTRLWYRLGLPVYLLPVAPGFRGYAGPGTVGPQTGGLRGFVAQVQPLVPPGYTAAVFKPSNGGAA